MLQSPTRKEQRFRGKSLNHTSVFWICGGREKPGFTDYHLTESATVKRELLSLECSIHNRRRGEKHKGRWGWHNAWSNDGPNANADNLDGNC